MPQRLRQQIHDFLRDYRKEVFALEHKEENVTARSAAAQKFAEEMLDQRFHYHFHQKVDPDRAETIQLIHNYCREALLPPVVTRIAERVLLLEQRHLATIGFVECVLEKLAGELEKGEPNV